MNKTLIIAGIISSVVAVSCAVGGAMLAINMQSSNVEDKEPAASAVEVKEKLNGWKQKNSYWYYYKDDEQQTDWLQDNNKWYFLGNDGKMRTGWIQDDNNWYYLNNDGTLATNTTIDGCYLNDKGLIEETPKPKVNSNNVNESSAEIIGNQPISSENQAMNIIYQNDDPELSLVYQGLFSAMHENEELNEHWYDFQLKEPVYIFYCFDDYTNDEVIIYYVGKDTGTVYRRDGGRHQLLDAHILKDKQIVKTYKCKQ